MAITVALASTATAQSASSLTFWLPGPANNPSLYSKQGLGTTSFPPVASIITSDPATTVFALGCPTSTASPSSIFNGEYYETCNWATDYGTYSIIDKTKHVLHRTGEQPSASMWWSCDYDSIKTKMTCDLEVLGDVNDNTGGPISGAVWPDNHGNVVAFATAEVVTEGRFGELDCGIGYQSSSARSCNDDGTGGKGTMSWGVFSESAATTGLMTASGSAPSVTATQGSGSAGATATASGSVTAASTGAAAGFGVEGGLLAGLVGAAAFAAW